MCACVYVCIVSPPYVTFVLVVNAHTFYSLVSEYYRETKARRLYETCRKSFGKHFNTLLEPQNFESIAHTVESLYLESRANNVQRVGYYGGGETTESTGDRLNEEVGDPVG